MPHMIKLHQRLKDQGLVLLGIHTTGSGNKMASWAKENGVNFPIAIDKNNKTTKAYRVDSYPDYYLIDRTGKLRVADLANRDLERAVKILLAEKAPAAKTKKAVKRSAPARKR